MKFSIFSVSFILSACQLQVQLDVPLKGNIFIFSALIFKGFLIHPFFLSWDRLDGGMMDLGMMGGRKMDGWIMEGWYSFLSGPL